MNFLKKSNLKDFLSYLKRQELAVFYEPIEQGRVGIIYRKALKLVQNQR